MSTTNTSTGGWSFNWEHIAPGANFREWVAGQQHGGTKRLGPFVLRAGAAVGPNRLLVEFQGKRYGIANTEPAIRSLLEQLRGDVRRAADLAREAEEKRRGETTTIPPAIDKQAQRADAFGRFARSFAVVDV